MHYVGEQCNYMYMYRCMYLHKQFSILTHLYIVYMYGNVMMHGIAFIFLHR